MNENLQALYSCRVVAELFGCSRQSVYYMCRNGSIPAINIGRPDSPLWRVPLSFIEKAMRGEARWKYPKALKRQCRTRVQAIEKIGQHSDVIVDDLDNSEDDDE